MQRAVEMLGGGILGFIAGSFLCAPLFAHVFGPTSVTWDTAACPSGIYTITSTATNVDTGRTYTTTTAHLRLPKGSLVQEFSDLPAGQYVVSASARDARGRTFKSGTQNISSQRLARGQQAVQTSGGVQTSAVARIAPVTPLHVTTSTPPAPADSPILERVLLLPRGMAELVAGTPGSEAGLLAMFPEWKSVAFIDSDDDGVVDEVRIEFVSGEVVLISTSG
jgi:hypothetical protein